MIKDTPGFHYAEGAAPFGELDIVLPHSRELGEGLSTEAQRAAESIFDNAWSKSYWLASEVGQQAIDEWLKTPYGENHPNLMRVTSRAFTHPKQNLTYAVKPDMIPDWPWPERFDAVVAAEIVGFGNAKLEVSGNPVERAIKWLRYPEKQYVNVANANVRPRWQGRHIGVALMHGLLSGFPEDRPATTYVARSNNRLLQALSAVGYQETGSQPRSDLIPGATFEEVRLQAGSAGEVRDRLARRFSWLNDAETIEPVS